jgi:hypothetical protein
MKKKPDPEMIDKENPEWTDAMFAKARPASELFPDLAAHSQKRKRGQRGPQKNRARARKTPGIWNPIPGVCFLRGRSP